MTRERPRPKSKHLPVQGPQRWTPSLLEAVAAGERQALSAILAEDTDAALIHAADVAFDRAADLARVALAKDPPPRPIACRDRCSACCVSKVVATAPEILRVAAHLGRTLSPEAFSAVLDRVRAADDRTRGMSRAARLEAKIPCPLLVDESCSVHPARPLICAGWTSLDRGACDRYFAAPDEEPTAPAYVPAYEISGAVMAGLAGACADRGLDGSLLELIAGLRIAMERPAAGERYRRRLPVFSLARDAESAAPRVTPDPR